MKKTIIFLGLFSLTINCSSDKEKLTLSHSTEEKSTEAEPNIEEVETEADFSIIYESPKCDDKEVLDLVKILATPKKNLIQVYAKYSYTDYSYYFDKLWYSKLYKGNNTPINIEEYVERSQDREKAIKKIIDLYNSKDAKAIELFNKYANTDVYGIRPQSTDKELKKCNCQATISFIGNEYDMFDTYERGKANIQYTAQLTTEGQIFVEVKSDLVENFLIDKRRETLYR